MNETGKRKFHINWVDIIIILVVIALAAAALLIRNAVGGGQERETYKIRFTAEAKDVTKQTADSFVIGEDIYNSSDNSYMGKLVAVETVPHVVMDYNVALEKFIQGEDPETVDLSLVIEGDGFVDEKDIHVGAFIPKVGKVAYLKGKGHAITSYVIGIDTMNAPVESFTDKGNGNIEIEYQIVISDIRKMSVDALHVGDVLYEASSGAKLGVVKNVEASPYKETRFVGDGVAAVEKPGRYRVIVTLVCNAVETEIGYFIDEVNELKVGAGTVFDDTNGVHVSSRYIYSSYKYYSILNISK